MLLLLACNLTPTATTPTPAPAPAVPAAASCPLTPHAGDLDALCQTLAAAWKAEESSEDLEPECVLPAEVILDQPDRQVAVFHIRGLFTERYTLAVRREGVWWWMPLVELHNPGAFGIFTELALSATAQQVLPGGVPEVLLSVREDRGDSDMGIDEWESEVTDTLYILGEHDGAVVSLEAIRTGHSFTRDRFGNMDDSELDPAMTTPGLPIHREEKQAVSFDGQGNITLTPDNEPPLTRPLGSGC